MPHTCRSRYPPGSAQLGGKQSFRSVLRCCLGPDLVAAFCTAKMALLALTATPHMLRITYRVALATMTRAALRSRARVSRARDRLDPNVAKDLPPTIDAFTRLCGDVGRANPGRRALRREAPSLPAPEPSVELRATGRTLRQSLNTRGHKRKEQR
jgi:hypothetical protein